MYEDNYGVEVPRSRARRYGTLAALWAALVAGVLLWQAWNYTGLFGRLAEWQFARFDRMFPAATIAGITALLSLPILFLLRREMRRHRRKFGNPTLTARMLRETTITRWLGGMTLFAALASLGLILWAMSGGEAKKTQLTSLPFSQGAEVEEGQVDLSAWVLTDRLGNYEQKGLFTRHYTMLAPVAGSADGKQMKYFLVTNARRPEPASQQRVTGYLREVHLPGGFERLFMNGGYSFDRPTYVIFPDAKTALRPRFNLAETAIRFAVILLIGFLIHRIHFRRVRREYKESINPEV